MFIWVSLRKISSIFSVCCSPYKRTCMPDILPPFLSLRRWCSWMSFSKFVDVFDSGTYSTIGMIIAWCAYLSRYLVTYTYPWPSMLTPLQMPTIWDPRPRKLREFLCSWVRKFRIAHCQMTKSGLCVHTISHWSMRKHTRLTPLSQNRGTQIHVRCISCPILGTFWITVSVRRDSKGFAGV